MVLITNGRTTLNVSMGAYSSVYKHKGFKIIGKNETKANVAPVVKKEEAPVVEEVKEEEVIAEEEPIVESEVDWTEELMEKPISQWSKDEVAKFAEAKGIDTSSAHKVGEAKDIVKKWIEKNM